MLGVGRVTERLHVVFRRQLVAVAPHDAGHDVELPRRRRRLRPVGGRARDDVIVLVDPHQGNLEVVCQGGARVDRLVEVQCLIRGPDRVLVRDQVLLRRRRSTGRERYPEGAPRPARRRGLQRRPDQVALSRVEGQRTQSARRKELAAAQIWEFPVVFARVFLHILNPFL